MKRRLTHAEIKQNHWYKVVRIPDHWENRYSYGVLNKVGRCQWVNPVHGVSMIFDNCLERIVPAYCLEPTANPTKTKEVPKKEILDESKVKVGNIYLVTETPKFYDRVGYACPVVGKFGTLIDVRGTGCLLVFGNEEIQHFIPFDCLQDTGKSVNRMTNKPSDEELIKKILENPLGILKIVRGLAKMNKDYNLKILLERGVLV